MCTYPVPWYLNPVSEPILKNLWKGSETSYVYAFREQLDLLAAKIFEKSGPVIYSRFNDQKNCAELLSDRNGVIVSVVVQGECSIPEHAIIQVNDQSISKEYFYQAFGGLRVTFGAI